MDCFVARLIFFFFFHNMLFFFKEWSSISILLLFWNMTVTLLTIIECLKRENVTLFQVTVYTVIASLIHSLLECIWPTNLQSCQLNCYSVIICLHLLLISTLGHNMSCSSRLVGVLVCDLCCKLNTTAMYSQLTRFSFQAPCSPSSHYSRRFVLTEEFYMYKVPL